MLKVILADDELHIRNLLKYLIHWEELGLTCVAEYDNGADVVQHIERAHVDIIISDVQMPEMNGLDMIREVQEKDPTCRFVVISGYRDFSYAQASVKLGVVDYILKPIDETELNRALAKIVDGNSSLEPGKAESTERRKHFLSVLLGQRNVEDAEQANQEFAFHFAQRGCWIVIWMALCRAQKEQNTSQYAQRKMEILKKGLESFSIDQESFMLSNLNYLLLVQFDPQCKEALLQALDRAYQDMLHSELPGDTLQYYLAVGKAVSQLDRVRESTASARFFITGRILYGTRRIYIADNMKQADYWQSESIQIPYEMGRRLDNALDCGDFCTLRKAITEAFAYAIEERPENAALCFSMGRQIGERLIRKMEQFGASPGETQAISDELENQLDNSDTMQRIESAVADICEDVLQRRMPRGRTDQNVYVLRAKAYINTHYAENISLASLAEQVHINPAYLSTLFKSETGVNYLDYLTAVRMDKAKQLLAAGNMNLSQIADAIGYGSTRYFSKLFEAQTGIRPGEYRRLHLKGLD